MPKLSMLARLILALGLIISAPVAAEPYLAVRPTDSLPEGAYAEPFEGGWSKVIIEVVPGQIAEVATLAELDEAYGDLDTALAAALSNTLTARQTLRFEGSDIHAQFLVEPAEATSGMLLLGEARQAVADHLGVTSLGYMLPTGTILVTVDLNQPDMADQLAQVAQQTASQAPDGLDDQTLSQIDGQLSVLSPATYTPTAEEILMSLGPDPENTIVITLKDGDVIIRLRDDVAPNHTARIKELAREGFYDGIVFHRVIEGFMAQTGDPTGTGTSGSGQNLNAEFSDAPFLRGTVGMARAASPNSADSQFFIMFADGGFLNGNYTVIGQVESGMEFVDQIKRGEPPVDPDQMISVRVQADL